MNRNQKKKNCKKPQNGEQKIKGFMQNVPDFASVPLALVCQSIQLLIIELGRRGYRVYDFDNKDKFVQGIYIMKGKIYLLMAKEAEHEKEQTRAEI